MKKDFDENNAVDAEFEIEGEDGKKSKRGENRSGRGASIGMSLALIIAGAILIAGHYIDFLSISNLWPLFMLIPAFALLFSFVFHPKGSNGALVPAVILTVLSVYFLTLNYTSWELTARTWPVFILAPGLGLLAQALFGGQKQLFPPAFIIITISVVAAGLMNRSEFILPVIFILIGLIILINTISKVASDKR